MYHFLMFTNFLLTISPELDRKEMAHHRNGLLGISLVLVPSSTSI